VADAAEPASANFDTTRKQLKLQMQQNDKPTKEVADLEAALQLAREANQSASRSPTVDQEDHAGPEVNKLIAEFEEGAGGRCSQLILSELNKGLGFFFLRN
jgi:hypothetical protein